MNRERLANWLFILACVAFIVWAAAGMVEW